MQAEEIRRLGEQCAELIRAKPSDQAHFTVREAWWKTVRALRVGPLRMEHLETEVTLEPAERATLRDALAYIDEGKNFKNDAPDAGLCIDGLETAARVLLALAKRMRSGKTISEMIAELLREAGVLAIVFGVLDGVLRDFRWSTAVTVVAVGVLLTSAGFWLERART